VSGPPYSLHGKRVWVAGHTGMVGSALTRRLQREGCKLLTVSHAELDLRRQAETEAWMRRTQPQVVFIAAARVGGIQANIAYPADFLYDNLAIATNIIHGAHLVGVEKLAFLGSSCMYPRLAAQPLHEDSLLTGPLEPTNEAYAIAKLAGIKLCQSYRRQHGSHFIAPIPTNLFGPGDNFDPAASHVVPAMIRKVQQAKRDGGNVSIWGTGKPSREFLFVDDAADAVVFLMRHFDGPEPINIGSGEDITISRLAETIAEVLGFSGTFEYDTSKPDGMPRKRLDSDRILALGWRATTPLVEGLRQTIAWYSAHRATRQRLAHIAG
jgi:GDP-L-fucose synthase